jgi:hypothetical protein
MNRRLLIAVCTVTLLGGCAGSNETSPQTTVELASSTKDTTATTASTLSNPVVTTEADSPAAVPVVKADLVRFIAATEAVLAGTPDAGAVNETPETYIALAEIACERFDDGESFEAVTAELLGTASTASRRLIGAVVGAATRTICREHANLIPLD